MNLTTQSIQSNVKVLNVAFDVSMDKLNLYTEIGDQMIEAEFPNQTLKIEQQIQQLLEQARDAGFEQMQIVCESTQRRILLVTPRLFWTS